MAVRKSTKSTATTLAGLPEIDICFAKKLLYFIYGAFNAFIFLKTETYQDSTTYLSTN